MIGIVDYGLGNIGAFRNAYASIGIETSIISSPSQLLDQRRIILPGVGSFDAAISHLHQKDLFNTLDKVVVRYRVPVLGVCLGMQLMAETSEEGISTGFGWIPAHVTSFKTLPSFDLFCPHMGWNNIETMNNHPILSNLPSSYFYFLHSFYFPLDTRTSVLSSTHYHTTFASGISRDNIFGFQFHPERSHDAGLQLLKNFATLDLC